MKVAVFPVMAAISIAVHVFSSVTPFGSKLVGKCKKRRDSKGNKYPKEVSKILDVPKFQKNLEHVCFLFLCCKILHPRSLYYPLVDEA